MTLTKVTEQMASLTSLCEILCQSVQKKQEEKRIEEEQAVKAQSWKFPVCYDDDDDEEGYNSLNDSIISKLPSYSAVTSTEPIDSLSMGDKHPDTIPATESDEFIKSRVENLVPNPSESEGENGCDVLAGFTTFYNNLFDDDYDFDSSDDQSLSVEDVREKIYSNHLFDEEIIPMEIDQHSLNVASDLIKSMPSHDSSVIISSKIDSLFDEFTDELNLLKSFLPGIDETDCHPEKEIHLTKRLLYDNSSPRPPEVIVSDNSNADIESFSPSPIPNEDSDSHMEEIDLYLNPDDHMPPGIEDDDYDSERDIPILEELLDNYSLSLPTNESYHFDIPSPYRPLQNHQMEKSPDLFSHLGLEAFQPSAECQMIINGKNTPVLDVPLFHFYPIDQFNWKFPVCYDDDDDEEGYNSLNDSIISKLHLYSAATPTEPIDSLSMGDEHLNTILAMESDEFIKSRVENLVPNPSESEGENGCDVLAGFTTFSNVLFDADYDFDSSDDQSMPNHDSSITISSKIDSLFDEFAGELTLLKSILPRIDETDCHPAKEIRLTKRLLNDNSSPRPPEEIISDNSNAAIESFSPYHILNEDSASHMEEIDLFLNPDDRMPPGIEDDDYDSERDIPILEELLDNYSLSLPTNESYHFDIVSPYRPPAKPPDGNTGTLNIKMLGDVSDQKVPIPNLTITHILNQEKSLDLLSHLGLEAFQPSAKCPMIINGKNIPLLDVPLFHFPP
nr:hypothetical protein [Tanacetum cinerariifolium]